MFTPLEDDFSGEGQFSSMRVIAMRCSNKIRRTHHYNSSQLKTAHSAASVSAWVIAHLAFQLTKVCSGSGSAATLTTISSLGESWQVQKF